MLSYPSGMTVSSRALGVLSDALRNQRQTRWRKLSVGRQALLVVAYLREGETYADLACGFKIGTSTVYRYLREALELLAATTPTLTQAIEVAARKAFVILDGTLLRIDRVGMASGYDRAFYSGKHKAHGLNVQVIANPVGRLVWPKLCTGSFFPSLLERRRRIDQALFALVMEAYLHGVSTRKVDDLMRALGADTGIDAGLTRQISPRLGSSGCQIKPSWVRERL
jgi:hypothetical protein